MKKSRGAAGRMARCTFGATDQAANQGPAAHAVIEVSGSMRSYRLTAGAQVDLDEVIGHDGDGVPLSLGEALGPHLVHFVDATTGAPLSAAPPELPAPPAQE